MSRRPFIIPIFAPHLGCPHRCIFCDQRTIAGAHDAMPSPEQVQERISRYLAYKGHRRGATDVAFYGGTFLGLPQAYKGSVLRAVQPFIDRGEVRGIRFSTRPDSVSEEAMGAVADLHVRAVEIGAQSMDDGVLMFSRRGHSAMDTERAVAVLRAVGVQVGIQIMPGLPGDNLVSMKETGRRVVALKPDFVRIYPAVVIRGTALEKWYREGRFTPLSLDRAVEVTTWLYGMFMENDIAVIRMGLHGGDSLIAPETVVAGPFHPAFGHLVHGAILLDRAVAALEGQEKGIQSAILHVHPRYLSRLIGDRRKNLKCLSRKFSLHDLRVVPDPSVRPGQVTVG